MQDRHTTDGPTAMSYGYGSGVTSQDTATDPADPLTGEAHAELFVRTPGGRLLAMLDYTGGTLSDAGADYYLLDDQKTVEATVPAAEPGTSQADGGDTNPDAVRYAYEPYGQTIRSWVDPDPGTAADAYTEDDADAPAEDYNPFGYVSGYTDDATGLVKFGTRYYAPQLGTWTQPDSRPGRLVNPLTMNLQSYAGLDPVTNSDESGRAYIGSSFDACILACLQLGVGYDGDPDVTIGFTVGPDIGVSGGPEAGLGGSEGWGATASCSFAAGPGGVEGQVAAGEGATASGGVGYQVGAGGGCSAGGSYTF